MSDYKKNINSSALDKLNKVIKQLPDYCKYYFNAKSNTLAPRTRLAYAEDLEIFFYYLTQTFPEYTDIKEIPISLLNSLKSTDIDDYMRFLERYEYKGNIYENNIQGKKRKLAALRELYKLFVKIDLSPTNPAQLVDTPKESSGIRKSIVRLETHEKVELIKEVSSEEGLSKKQLEMKRLLEDRDKAILLLFLGTGLRVSELVGLDVEDVNLDFQYLFVIGKGNKNKEHFFNAEVKDCLEYYLECVRPTLIKDKSEPAFFLSRRGTRLCVRSVEYLVDKYSRRNANVTTISPHKLRSTYGSDLLAATGDIALVSDNLSHSDISTTKRYYMAEDKERLRKNKDFNIF